MEVCHASAAEIEHVAHTAGDEMGKDSRFAAFATKRGIGVAVSWLLAKELHRSSPVKFTWIWPSPYPQAARDPRAEAHVGPLRARNIYEIATRGRDAREAFRNRMR